MFGKRSKDATALERLVAELLREPELRSQRWDHLFVWTEFETGVSSMTGFVYRGDDWDWAGVGDVERNSLDLFAELRKETSDPVRGPWDACLFRLDKGSKEPDLTFLWGAEADEWRITPKTSMQVMEKARPR